jgi:polyisoprenoid-binding protein YceI
MKHFSLFAAILALTAPLAVAQTSTWTSDSAHSEADFTVRHNSVSNVHGRFGHVAATLVYNATDVNTVDTGESPRDNHLKTDTFFDVAKFSTATFTSTSVVKDGDKLTVSGNFTLHGVTKPIVLDVDGPSTPVENGMDHKLHSGFTATSTISRNAFGIGTSFPAALIGDDVKLTIEVEVIKQ